MFRCNEVLVNNNLFAEGISQGYLTMDALGAGVFAGIIINAIVAKGYDSKEEKIKSLEEQVKMLQDENKKLLNLTKNVGSNILLYQIHHKFFSHILLHSQLTNLLHFRKK